MSLTIRNPYPADEARWRVLWAGYIQFYGANVADDVTDTLWARLLDPLGPVRCRLALYNGEIIGFAHHVLHAGTWGKTEVCYLEDLFVDESVRGHGAATALIEDLVAEGKRQGWHRVYWVTETNNARARRVYDRVGKLENFVRYCVEL